VVRSALTSTGVAVEVVVVDDASPDDTWNVLQRLAVADFRILDRPAYHQWRTVCSAQPRDHTGYGTLRFRSSMPMTRWPDRLALLVGLADKQNADIVVDNMTEVDADGLTIGTGRFLKSDMFQHNGRVSSWNAGGVRTSR